MPQQTKWFVRKDNVFLARSPADRGWYWSDSECDAEPLTEEFARGVVAACLAQDVSRNRIQIREV